MRKKELPMRYLVALAFVITTAVWAYRDHANGARELNALCPPCNENVRRGILSLLSQGMRC